MSQARKRVDGIGLLLLAPAGVLLAVLFLLPVAYAFYLGLTNASLIGVHAQHYWFTGGANLRRLWQDRTFWHSLWLTAVFLFGSSILGVTVIGMALALLMQHASIFWQRLAGAVAILAWMLPPVTAAMVWYAFSTTGGTLSLLTGGHTDPLDSHPMLIVILANVWATAGFSMMVLGAGLRGISSEVREAARMENASRIQTFVFVTLPLMRRTLVTNLLLVTLIILANYALTYIMTAGGPNDATNILPIYAYQQGFTFSNLGYGALVGDVLVLIATAFAYLYVRALRQD
ncbi:MAG TPA: sugar ABC transporter permease [Acidisoma sp.]|jgi:multiple sugar transport system permease protein|uniref:carbohydrate ABC transporter permease n=1 Tax=Acidisoma sp. TaxID=1872115 RepID=UPI002B81E29B|nr:sugar ABC transporter permease [Acidisoma sp.]HTH99594.1 sugar ABC transporter permease [Acidisoma sp.]